jgi:hypothetical protein
MKTNYFVNARVKIMIKVYKKLTDAQLKELQNGIIEVTGKAMNRTALGIVDAVFTLYPNITINELKELLPDTLNPSAPKNFKSIFKPFTDKNYGVFQAGTIRGEIIKNGFDINSTHFTGEGETFKSSDGVEILVSKLWESSDTETGENDLQTLINHIEKYGIRVVKVEKKEAFNKGEYNLKILNPSLLKSIQKQENKINYWWLIILIILLLGLSFYLFNK